MLTCHTSKRQLALGVRIMKGVQGIIHNAYLAQEILSQTQIRSDSMMM